MNYSILIIDDEVDFLDSVRRGLLSAGLKNLRLESDPRVVATAVQNGEHFDMALIDITMPWINGIQLLEMIKTNSPETECIMVTAVNEARVAVECLQKGAYDYLTKPISRDELVSTLKRAMERRRLLEIISVGKTGSLPQIKHKDAFAPIITQSEKMLRLLKEAELHAESDVPVLITGESGTGKELLAKAIHRSSPRAQFPFTSINMASLTGSLFDAEFFGHTKGAFTGAEKDRAGYLEHSNRGSLFLDEIGDLPLDFQGKLLRVLQEGEIIKLGTSQVRKIDVRFIAATNADLDKLLAKGQFRKDLYYRLKGAWLRILPLRERREDLPVLINAFLREFRGEIGADVLEEETLQILMNYDYPGNIRELRSIIQAASNLAQKRPIGAKHLPDYLKGRKKAVMMHAPVTADGPILPLAETERIHILKAYEGTNHNKLQTAKLLGIGLNTLRRKLASYDIN
jgi:DNA-binding NtrC family response regulator